MKLHELSPAAGSVTPAWRKGRGTGSGNGKTAGKGHKGPAAEYAPASRAVRSRFTENFRREASITSSQRTMLS